MMYNISLLSIPLEGGYLWLEKFKLWIGTIKLYSLTTASSMGRSTIPRTCRAEISNYRQIIHPICCSKVVRSPAQSA
jgi:hypothetical protein